MMPNGVKFCTDLIQNTMKLCALTSIDVVPQESRQSCLETRYDAMLSNGNHTPQRPIRMHGYLADDGRC